MSGYARRGVHGQTVEAIDHRVFSGRIGEGDTLDLGALQAELGVSLTALRESLKVLAAKGMVDARQKRGTFVRPRADWHLLDGDVLRWQFEFAGPPAAGTRARAPPAVTESTPAHRCPGRRQTVTTARLAVPTAMPGTTPVGRLGSPPGRT